MKILIVSDKESSYIWDYFDADKFKDIDLIISCGDLDPKYLSFLVTMINVPVLYIHGNHDSKYETDPPLGCINIEDDIVDFQGIRIMGLGGSYKYRKGPFMYTERGMARRAKKLKRKLFRYSGVDIVVTHASPQSEHNLEDIAHRGFKVFRDIILQYKPSYFIHGHDHLNYSSKAKRLQTIDQTTVVNAYRYYVIDYTPNSVKYKRKIAHILPFFDINYFE